MSTLVYRAELKSAVAGVIGILEMYDMKSLRREIAREWVPILEDGDIIQVYETYRD